MKIISLMVGMEIAVPGGKGKKESPALLQHPDIQLTPGA